MFKEIDINKIKINPFTVINDDWFLITAGDKSKYNTMTASYGAMGICFSKNVFTIYVKKSRYTYEFLENSDYFSICFFDEIYHHGLNVCGNLSGRTSNKVEVAGFTPNFKEKAPMFEEAKTVFICKKLLSHEFDKKDFVSNKIYDACYDGEEPHTMFMGEIVKVLHND